MSARRLHPLLFLLAIAPVYAGVNENCYGVLENGAGHFKVTIFDEKSGAVTLDGVSAVAIDDVIFD